MWLDFAVSERVTVADRLRNVVVSPATATKFSQIGGSQFLETIVRNGCGVAVLVHVLICSYHGSIIWFYLFLFYF